MGALLILFQFDLWLRFQTMFTRPTSMSLFVREKKCLRLCINVAIDCYILFVRRCQTWKCNRLLLNLFQIRFWWRFTTTWLLQEYAMSMQGKTAFLSLTKVTKITLKTLLCVFCRASTLHSSATIRLSENDTKNIIVINPQRANYTYTPCNVWHTVCCSQLQPWCKLKITS
jgi:hypothetical protein